ncbi:hypothetical protein C1C98_08635 [Pseudomonas ogarae]|uniref:Uncharacterized protein n=1 Tax=Pseudomonas ogarae (strain DSM 112162 / CECT 30235 / F113) TaxID=1114970 RepID=A0ABM6R8B2_PSEO1|nr:hypothetical protein C1C98_08635 [Pseudomonas ogarae]
MWRGDLSPLGCEAPLKAVAIIYLICRGAWVGVASQPSGDKSPRHRGASSLRIAVLQPTSFC